LTIAVRSIDIEIKLANRTKITQADTEQQGIQITHSSTTFTQKLYLQLVQIILGFGHPLSSIYVFFFFSGGQKKEQKKKELHSTSEQNSRGKQTFISLEQLVQTSLKQCSHFLLLRIKLNVF
jgi:hypothetical protein